MIKIWLSFCAIALVAIPFSADAQVSVKGYYRSNGTYVQPHMRSAPNNTTADNWSTIGNINPYTGEKGTTNPPPRYVPVPAPYVPITQAPPSRSSAPYVPKTYPSPSTKKEQAVDEIMALLYPQGSSPQKTEYQSCYTIYDCQ